jgi:hypothetical protein
MAQRASESRELVRGAARFKDLVYVISKGKALLEKDVAHSSLIAVDQGEWSDAADTTWNSTAVAVARKPEEKAVLVGEDGDVVTYVGGKSKKEAIKPAPVMIRNAKTIDGEVYACGMKRQVFRRTGEKKWLDMSAPRAGDTEALGFEAIDGFAANDIYAAGWGGEVWRWDGARWSACASPTTATLTAICCAGDGRVYAAGQGGVLLRGRGDTWELVPWADEVSVDLWDLCWFQGVLYVATMTGLFTLQGNRLEAVDMGGPVTCYSLSEAEDVLWSVGVADVASFDGTTWTRYD